MKLEAESCKLKDMIAVFYGGDRIKAGKAAGVFIAKQKADEIISFDEITADAATLLSHAGQAALFGGNKLIKCDGVFEREDVQEAILKNLGSFSKSLNIFVFIESSLDAETGKRLKKYANAFEEYRAAKKKEAFNIFSLAEALGRRDKKSLWVLLVKALRAGKPPEEIAGTLFWQLKVLYILSQGGGTTLNPFVMSKGKANLRNWKREELLDLSYKLINGYHAAHRGRGDLAIAHERFALSI